MKPKTQGKNHHMIEDDRECLNIYAPCWSTAGSDHLFLR